MKKLALILPIALLAACGEEPAAEPTPAPTEVVTPEPVSTLPAPTEDLFKETFASTCEGAEPVNTAVCRRAMGADTVTCEFGLGEDQYLRHKATLAVNETNDGWLISDAAALCAEHGAHHSAN